MHEITVKMAHTKQTEERKQTIKRLKHRIGMDIAIMYINYGMTTDMRGRLMERMGGLLESAWSGMSSKRERKREEKHQESHSLLNLQERVHPPWVE